MNKIRFYQFLVLGLVVCNVVLLSFLLFGQKKGKNRNFKGPERIIVKRLGFDKQQVQKFKGLIDEHKKSLEPKVLAIRNLKQNLYAKLSDQNQNTKIIDSLQAALSATKLEIEEIHYAHFLDIKNLCTADQLPKFTALSKDMAKLFAPPNRRPLGKK